MFQSFLNNAIRVNFELLMQTKKDKYIYYYKCSNHTNSFLNNNIKYRLSYMFSENNFHL